MRLTGVSELKGSAAGRPVYILGSGPSLSSFPLDTLRGQLVVALNTTIELYEATYWLFGDRKLARWCAPKIARLRPGATRLICNYTNVERVETRFPPEADVTIYRFTNERDRYPMEDFLQGRWTILTIALSLAVLLGASQAVLLGCDMGSVNDTWYAEGIRFPPPRKQHIYVGQWRKWVQYGFKEKLWPIDVVTTSPYYATNCPGTPVRTVSIESAIPK